MTTICHNKTTVGFFCAENNSYRFCVSSLMDQILSVNKSQIEQKWITYTDDLCRSDMVMDIRQMPYIYAI